MSSNNKPVSGEVTADTTGVAVGVSGSLETGVWLTVPSDASNGIEVISAASGFTTGDKMGVDTTKFYPTNCLADLLVKRDGGVDVTVSYYAF